MITRCFAVFSAVTGLLLVGCLPTSPLFNHADADQIRGSLAEKPKGCLLLFSNEGLCASLTWTKEPTEGEKGHFIFRFWKKDAGTEAGPYVNPSYVVAVKLWMPSMGHGSSPVKVAQAADSSNAPVPGVYEASDVYFMMNGKWEIWVQLKREKQVIEQAKIDYQF